MIDNLNIEYHRENNNIYVNPAWNKIFDMGTTPYVTILNNDSFIDEYFYKLDGRASERIGDSILDLVKLQ